MSLLVAIQMDPLESINIEGDSSFVMGLSAERRGQLHFYNMKVDVLAPDAAMLIGQYRLTRGPRTTEGVNTRLFRKIRGQWLITVNHVSAYDVAPTPTAPAAK